ncbi:MAG: trypsin-like serine protease [Anaerolineales bacterium]
MHKKMLFAVFSVIAILAMAVSPVYAITGNWVEDNEHPFVGLAVFYDANGDFIWRCSGTLLSPTVFLTAGHCADTEGGAVTARVYFQQDAGVNYDPTTEVDPVTGYPEYCAAGTEGVTCATSDEIYNYGYTGSLTLPNTHDVGILILDQPISLPEYGELPEAGLLDSLATSRGTQDTIFTVSGYGLTYKEQAQNGKPNISYRERLMAEATLVNLNSALNAGFNLQTNGNGAGKGGTCNGDSGGPVFLGEYSSNLVVGVTSFGLNALCRGTDFAFRIDQPDVLAWIQSFL